MLMQRDKNLLKFLEGEFKSITIRQAHKLFWQSKYGYDHARKRLAILKNMGLLKQDKNFVTGEYVYYTDKMMSPHDLYILDFYSNLVFYGAEILECKKQPRYTLNGKYIEPDAFIQYKFNNIIYSVLIEVNFTHHADLSKYEPYIKTFEQEPYIAVISNNPKKQQSSFDVVYLDTDLTDFVLKILG